jgi:putative DNA primase/helicase
VLFLVHGETNAGKSTFIEALKMVTGDYVSTADFETFVKSNKIGGVRNDIARLAGARLVVSIEVDEGKALAEGLIKSLTGGDSVAARFLYQEAFEFKPSFKLWLVANHAPKVAAHDGAMWRRILRLPFEHIVPEDRRNTSLKARLHDPVYAGPAILAWAVMGCLEWQRNGLKVPDCVKEATQEYRDEMDPLRDFISDCCEIDVNDPVAWESTWDIMRRYSDWAASNGIRYTLGKEKVSERLRQLGCKPLLKKINGLVSRGWSFIKIDKKVTPYAPF